MPAQDLPDSVALFPPTLRDRTRPAGSLPAMAWVHGGAPMHPAEELDRQGVVVVSLNRRPGFFVHPARCGEGRPARVRDPQRLRGPDRRPGIGEPASACRVAFTRSGDPNGRQPQAVKSTVPVHPIGSGHLAVGSNDAI